MNGSCRVGAGRGLRGRTKVNGLPHGRIYCGSHIAQYIYPGRKWVLTTISGQKVAFLSLQKEDFFPV